MRTILKKMSGVLAGVLFVSTLAACSSFDATAYLKAILDNSYKNDQTGIVELNYGTAEEAAEIYEAGIESVKFSLLGTDETSEEFDAEYTQICKDIYASVKYTVGEAVLVDDETYEVTVTYEKMNVFENAFTSYQTVIAERIAEWTTASLAGEEIPTEEEQETELIEAFNVCLKEALANATYDAPATMTVRLHLVDNLWSPNTDDIGALELALFDYDAIIE